MRISAAVTGVKVFYGRDESRDARWSSGCQYCSEGHAFGYAGWQHWFIRRRNPLPDLEWVALIHLRRWPVFWSTNVHLVLILPVYGISIAVGNATLTRDSQELSRW